MSAFCSMAMTFYILVSLIFFSLVVQKGASSGFRRFVITDLPTFYDRESAPAIGHQQSEGHELDLIRALTGGNYSKWVKPRSKNGPLLVQTRLFLIRIQEVSEAEETLLSTVRFQLNWQDPALAWRPSDFGNLTSIVVPGGLLWIPDLQIVNAVDDMYELLHDSSFAFRVYSDGNVWFHPTGKIATHCRYSLLFYPFDYQRCSIIIESVIHQDSELKIAIRSNKTNPISLGMFAENEIWELVEDSVVAFGDSYQSGTNTFFSRVQFTMTIKRRPNFYVMCIIVPTCLLAVVTLFTYLVPIHYVDRTIQSVTVLLAVAVFEAMIAESLPKSSERCMLTIYLTIILSISALTVFVSSLCLAIVDPGEFIEAPWGIPNLIRTICPCVKNQSARKASSTENLDLTNELPGSPKPTPRHHHRYNQHSKQNHVELVPKHVNEPERHLSRSKRAWFTAYAINWIGFVVALLATVVIPLVAFVLTPPGYDSQSNDHGKTGHHFSYYGE